MTRLPFSRKQLIMAGACLAAGVVAALGWSQLASPVDMAGRMKAIDARVVTAERLSRDLRGAQAHPEGAICRAVAVRASADLTARLQSAGNAAGLAIAGIESFEAAGSDSRLVEIGFTLEAIGRYDGLVSYLGQLSQGAPEIFVEEAVLSVGAGDERQLSLRGRILCLKSSA